MITANEIRNLTFSKQFRGYNKDEIKQFVSMVANDYEMLYSDNARLQEKCRRFEEDLSKYRQMEEIMNNSIILAQQTAEAVKDQARKEAALILEESKKKISDILAVYQELIKRLNMFNGELKAQVSGHLEMIEKNTKKIENMSDFFYSGDMNSIMGKMEKLEIININKSSD